MFARTFIVASVFALLASAGPCVRKYTIKEGDVCDSISAANNVSTYQLAVINAGVIDPLCSNLVPGNEICIGYQNEDCSTTYVVKKDDTCEGIAGSSGLNSTMLWANNPQLDAECGNLYIGEVLCVAKSVTVPPSPSSGSIPSAVPSTATLASTPASTPVGSTPTAIPSPSPTSISSSDDDEDESNWPYCDEL